MRESRVGAQGRGVIQWDRHACDQVCSGGRIEDFSVCLLQDGVLDYAVEEALGDGREG